MTSLEWAIYNTIKEKGTLTQKGLASLVNERLGYKALNYNDKATNCKNDEKGDHCKQLQNLVTSINASPDIEKMIVVKNYTYKLGTEEECLEYALKLKEKAMRLLKRYGDIMIKYGKNDQGKLVSCQGKQIDGTSTARPFVEAFVTEK